LSRHGVFFSDFLSPLANLVTPPWSSKTVVGSPACHRIAWMVISFGAGGYGEGRGHSALMGQSTKTQAPGPAVVIDLSMTISMPWIECSLPSMSQPRRLEDRQDRAK
jgi:hypothetical protein